MQRAAEPRHTSTQLRACRVRSPGGIGSRGGNTLTVGGGYDGSRSSFHQSTQLGYLNPDRSLTGLDAFADGVDGRKCRRRAVRQSRGSGWPCQHRERLCVGRDRDSRCVDHNLSARFNRTSIGNLDRLNPGGGSGSLDGDHAYSRLNPAAGVTFSPSEISTSTPATAKAAVRRRRSSWAAPTRIARASCPNALAGDPPLDQVVTRTCGGRRARHARSGVRGMRASSMRTTRTTSCLSRRSRRVSATSRTSGRPVARESSSASTRARARFSVGAGYTWLDATFESEETIDGTGNSTNDAAPRASGLRGHHRRSRPGDRIPLIPRAHVQGVCRLSGHAEALGRPQPRRGIRRVRAREREQCHQPDGTYYLGPGSTPAYGIVNIGVRSI